MSWLTGHRRVSPGYERNPRTYLGRYRSRPRPALLQPTRPQAHSLGVDMAVTRSRSATSHSPPIRKRWVVERTYGRARVRGRHDLYVTGLVLGPYRPSSGPWGPCVVTRLVRIAVPSRLRWVYPAAVVRCNSVDSSGAWSALRGDVGRRWPSRSGCWDKEAVLMSGTETTRLAQRQRVITHRYRQVTERKSMNQPTSRGVVSLGARK